MPLKSIDEILPFVQKPSRYLGSEVNRIHKDWHGVKLRLLLAFPDLYDIGTSHFGIQILYHLLNQQQDIAAERVFAPANDMAQELRRNSLPLPSMESRHPMGEFDIVGFSLLYELNYTNVLNMLDLGSIPPRWQARRDEDPLVIAGGPAVCNPEPMADFFDAMVFGDGEQVILKMAEAWISWKADGGRCKEALLEAWSKLEGVYVPRFFIARYDHSGFQHLEPSIAGGGLIARAIVPTLDAECFPDRPIIPFGKPIHDRLRLEISRGCTRGCRFCQAGMIYRPVRERSPQDVLSLIQKALVHTGYEDLSLLSLSTGDYTCLAPLIERLMQLCRSDRVAVSLPSLRAGSLTSRLMELIRSVRKTGFTIAPEAGSQRLRDVINKNITYDDVQATVSNAFELGWHVIKLYFMIGLPTETDTDLAAIVDMVRKLKQIKGPRRHKGQINVSITTFVPKPHTPFQWARQITLDESKRKIRYLKQHLDIPGVHVKWQKPEMSVLEGLLARGDRRISDLIEQAWRNGCIFDGWNDQFDFQRWLQALEKCPVDHGFFTTRQRSLDEPLPWQHMNAKVDPEFLKSQWEAAICADKIDDCRHGNCHACGVCDFKGIKPLVFDQYLEPAAPVVEEESSNPEAFVWLALRYTKLGDSRFFGHLELGNIFARAIRRAKIAVQYSKGFHPMPKISFDDPLPLGIESQSEEVRIMVSVAQNCPEVVEGLNRHLPDGIRIIDCRLRSLAKKEAQRLIERYSIQLSDRLFDPDIVGAFDSCSAWPYVRTNHKGHEHRMDLKRAIHNMVLKGPRELVYDVAHRFEFTIRPLDVVTGIFKLPAELLLSAKVIKLGVRAEISSPF